MDYVFAFDSLTHGEGKVPRTFVVIRGVGIGQDEDGFEAQSTTRFVARNGVKSCLTTMGRCA